MIDPLTLATLGGVGLVAGFIDAIAGGGGLISVPALLSAGLPPIATLATNKMQSVVGTTIAALTFGRKGFFALRQMVLPIAATFAGAYLGALSVKQVDTSLLASVVPAALVLIALYFLVSPRLTDSDRAARLGFAVFVPITGFLIGFYDGLFGPGTGSFFTLAFVSLFGLGVTRAAGHTKLLNATSNYAALALFIPAGDVVWSVALTMAAGQLAGGYLGALTGIRFGASIIRPLVVVVSIAMALRLLFS
ncbi:MAG: TSUP family transporter [Alphaproteobacteria bacterium]|nr:TSUP family transporter [Alphaproteobacteria bacterium]